MENDSKGFTVIELLIAFAVLSIIVVAASGFFSQSFRFTSFNEDKLTAVHLSSLVLERVQESFSETACPSEGTNLFPSYQHLFPEVQTDGSFILNDKRFYITVHLYCNSDSPLKTLHVLVHESVSLDKLLSQNFGYVELVVGGGT